MPLDGLRAWIGEVERKLGMRTRVFLVLSLIAIGGAGAAIYLAIDANQSSVSESDVQALQREIEARVGSGGAELAQVEAEVSALKAELERLHGTGGGGQGGGSGGGGSGSSGSSGSGSGGSSGSGGGHSSGSGSSGSGTGGKSSGSGASTGTVPETSGKSDAARLGELLQEAKEASEKAEHK